jgi:hypothetical protein
MGVVEQTSGAVESQLSVLEDSYGSFPVNQRTVTVPTTEYEQRRNQRERIDLYTKVHNEQLEVLYVGAGSNRMLPSTSATVDDGLENTARGIVEETAGISCQIEGVGSVTILGLHDRNDTDRETVYTLAVLFEATHTGGRLTSPAVWQEFDADDHPVYA